MAQQFQADAQALSAASAGFQNVETNGPSTNSIPVAYQNAKAKGICVVLLVLGTGVTSIRLRIRRNINAENVVVADSGLLNVTASQIVELELAFVDPIPDGRNVQYTVTVLPAGATSNIVMAAGTYIEAVLLSG